MADKLEVSSGSGDALMKLSKESAELEELKARFHEELLTLCARTVNETGYNPRDFRNMILRNGGFEAARRLLQPPVFPFHDGLAKLSILGRLDLSLEEMVLQSPWKELFESEGLVGELALAKQRLGKK